VRRRPSIPLTRPEPAADVTPGAAAEISPLPPGIVHISDALAQAVARLALAKVEPALTIDDWTLVLRASRRETDRMRAAAELPGPDFFIGRMPRWHASTVREWLAERDRNPKGRA
jgi:hypothetical protein